MIAFETVEGVRCASLVGDFDLSNSDDVKKTLESEKSVSPGSGNLDLVSTALMSTSFKISIGSARISANHPKLNDRMAWPAWWQGR
jgi:hypothetical protein